MGAHLPEAQRIALAASYVGGIPITELANVYGYSYNGMHHLLTRDTDMLALVQERLEILQAGIFQARLILYNNFKTIIVKAIAVANDDSHEHQTHMQRYLIDKVWPDKGAAGSNGHATSADSAVLGEIRDQLLRLADKHDSAVIDVTPIRDDPHVLSGEAALPSTELMSSHAG